MRGEHLNLGNLAAEWHPYTKRMVGRDSAALHGLSI